jgi:hypothetical protein
MTRGAAAGTSAFGFRSRRLDAILLRRSAHFGAPRIFAAFLRRKKGAGADFYDAMIRRAPRRGDTVFDSADTRF